MAVLCISAFAAPAAQASSPAPPLGCGVDGSFEDGSLVDANLPNAGTLESQVGVSGVGPVLRDLDVTLGITHPTSGQLKIDLVSPEGTTVTLVSERGGSDDDVFDGTLFDDSATLLATDSANYVNDVTAGPLVPEEALAAFAGENPNGVWKLRVEDTNPAGAGHINGWEMNGTTCSAVPAEAIQTFAQPDANPPIDNGSTTSQLAVSGAGCYLRDVNAKVHVTGTRASDVELRLISPSGKPTVLTTDNGFSNDNVFDGTVWDDGAGKLNPPGPATLASYLNLIPEPALVPEGAMGAFIGENPNGTWQLELSDDAATQPSTLTKWSLTMRTVGCPPEQTQGSGTPGTAPKTTALSMASCKIKSATVSCPLVNRNPFDVTASYALESVKRVTVSRKRKLTLGKRTLVVKAGGTATLKFKLSRKNRKLLARAKRLRLRSRLVTSAPGNATVKSSHTFTLKAPKVRAG